MLEKSSKQLIHVTFHYLRQPLHSGCPVLSEKIDIIQLTVFHPQTSTESSSVGQIAVYRWETISGHLFEVLPHSSQKTDKGKTESWFCEPLQTEFSRSSQCKESVSSRIAHTAFSRRVLGKNLKNCNDDAEFRHFPPLTTVNAVLGTLKVISTAKRSTQVPENFPSSPAISMVQ